MDDTRVGMNMDDVELCAVAVSGATYRVIKNAPLNRQETTELVKLLAANLLGTYVLAATTTQATETVMRDTANEVAELAVSGLLALRASRETTPD